MLRNRHFDILLAMTTLLACAFPLDAQNPGDNIYKKAGIISNLSGGPPAIKFIPIRIPELGKRYEVKVNFIKVETSTSAIDSYIDYLNEQAKARGEQTGSAKWDEIRSLLMEVTSKADFELLDPSDHTVGRASDLGATTFFRTVKFTGNSHEYKVKLRCTSGAGAYLLTLEWD